MPFVKQRRNDDCGVCCAAMLLDTTYTQAKRLIFGRTCWDQSHVTETRDIIRAIARSPEYTNPWPRLTVCADWYDIPDHSLVKIPHPNGRRWHWVVWYKRKVYDPARGVFHVVKYRKRPSSYLQVVRVDASPDT